MGHSDNTIDILTEETKLVGLVDGLLLIKRERVWSDGARLGGEFFCEPAAMSWLADQLELAADDRVPEVTHHAPPDHLVIFVRGGEHGAPINVHVHNRREPTSSHGKTYTLSGMSPETARLLAAELRAYRP